MLFVYSVALLCNIASGDCIETHYPVEDGLSRGLSFSMAVCRNMLRLNTQTRGATTVRQACVLEPWRGYYYIDSDGVVQKSSGG